MKFLLKLFAVADILDDSDPMRVPVQTVQRHIRSSSPNTSCEILPLPGMYSLSIEVVGLAAHEAGFFVGMMYRGKIVEEVYPIEGIHLHHVHQVHGCGGTGEGGLVGRKADRLKGAARLG